MLDRVVDASSKVDGCSFRRFENSRNAEVRLERIKAEGYFSCVKKTQQALVVSARGMTDSERKRYEKK
jgi:uncharacterized DUF497 family protein